LIDYDNLFGDPAFAAFEPERIEGIKDVMAQLQGKTPAEALGILTEFNRSLPYDRKFGKEERTLMLRAFLHTMPADERKKYEPFLKMTGFL